jgi:hypothetical protein
VPSVFRTILTLVCALYLGGAHWMVLQVTAWTSMIVTRTSEVGVTLAVETTFDGKNPCRMCDAVQEAQKEEQQQPISQLGGAVKELKLVSLASCELPPLLATEELVWRTSSEDYSRCMDAPPTRPPIA